MCQAVVLDGYRFTRIRALRLLGKANGLLGCPLEIPKTCRYRSRRLAIVSGRVCNRRVSDSADIEWAAQIQPSSSPGQIESKRVNRLQSLDPLSFFGIGVVERGGPRYLSDRKCTSTIFANRTAEVLAGG